VVRKQDGTTKRSKKMPIFRRSLGGVTRVLVTAAQNATPVHKGFMASLESAANHLNAEIVAIPFRYKNPTSIWSKSQENDESWDARITPHLCNVRKKLNANLTLLGDIKVQATSGNPLARMDALTHGESAIVGHPKLALRTVPTPQSRFPKILTTTGACTVPNYSDTALGKLGEFHHRIGAAMVELKGKKFHLRQINADSETGEFYDLHQHFSPDGTSSGWDAAALVMGDLHADYADPQALKATREQIQLLRPKHLIWHDVDDAHTISPHHRGNPFATIAKVKAGRTCPHDELKRSIDLVADMTPDYAESVIVFSNHNEMLARWIRDTDWKTQPGNAEFYLQTAQMMSTQTRLSTVGITTPDPFIYWGRKHAETLGKNIRFLEADESFQILGIETGMHGHWGPNGSRGSLKALARIGVKSMFGHGHGPGIYEGAMQVGTLTRLLAEYTHGPGGWLNTNGVIYANAKRSLLNIFEGQWRLN
jgi:hypothetical protein